MTSRTPNVANTAHHQTGPCAVNSFVANALPIAAIAPSTPGGNSRHDHDQPRTVQPPLAGNTRRSLLLFLLGITSRRATYIGKPRRSVSGGGWSRYVSPAA